MQLYSPEIANGKHPEIDSTLEQLATEWNVSVPEYRVNEPQEAGVLAFYNTDDKTITFGDVLDKNVVVHEMAHHIHESLSPGHCERKNCENFAYLFENLYGKAHNLYRLADCPLNGNQVYLRQYNASSFPVGVSWAQNNPTEAAGLIVASGSIIYMLYHYGYKGRKPFAKGNTLKTAGLAAATAVGVGLVLFT